MSTQPATPANESMAEQFAQPSNLLDQIAAQDEISKNERRFNYAWQYGQAAAQSAYFSDAASQSQAAMKIMTGYELGLTPAVSLQGIKIIKGNVSMTANLVAALLKRAGYGWKIGAHNESGCQLFPYHNGSPILDQAGQHIPIEFSRAHAEAADLTTRAAGKKDATGEAKSMYDKYGPDMYFARCIVRFMRRYAPEITNGIVVYTPDEIDEIAVQQPAAFEMPRRKEEVR